MQHDDREQSVLSEVCSALNIICLILLFHTYRATPDIAKFSQASTNREGWSHLCKVHVFCLNEVINIKKDLVLYVLKITDFLKEVQKVSELEIDSEDDSFQMTGFFFSDDEK